MDCGKVMVRLTFIMNADGDLLGLVPQELRVPEDVDGEVANGGKEDLMRYEHRPAGHK